MKGIFNWRSPGSPSKLFHKGVLKTKSQDVADAQNEFFIEKIRLIKEALSSSTGDPLCLLRILMKNRSCSFKFKPAHPDTVKRIIEGLSNSKSFGFDNLI